MRKILLFIFFCLAATSICRAALPYGTQFEYGGIIYEVYKPVINQVDYDVVYVSDLREALNRTLAEGGDTFIIPDTVEDEFGCEYVVYGIDNATLPEGSKELNLVGSEANNYLKGLKRVYLPRWTNTISEILNACCDLEYVYLGESLEDIFRNCLTFLPKLEYLDLPPTLRRIGAESITDSGIKKLDLSNNSFATSQADFFWLEELEEIIFPDGKPMGFYMDSYCCLHKIKKVDLCCTTSSIGRTVFGDCPELETVILPRNDKLTIRSEAFRNSPNIKEIYCPNEIPPVEELGRGELFVTDPSPESKPLDKSKCILYVPLGCADLYRVSSEWSGFENIMEYDFAADSNSVSAIVAQDKKVIGVYDLNGRPAAGSNRSGVHIVKYSDGSVRKVIL